MRHLPTEDPDLRLLTPEEAGESEGRLAMTWDELTLSGGP